MEEVKQTITYPQVIKTNYQLMKIPLATDLKSKSCPTNQTEELETNDTSDT